MQTRAAIDSLVSRHRLILMAERVGFEPTNTVRCYTLSRRAPSTARPPLLKPQSAPTAGRDCSRRTPLVLRFAPDRCSFAATSKIAPAILSNPRTRLGVTHFPGVRLRPLGHLSINLNLLKPPGGMLAANAARTLEHLLGCYSFSR